MRKCFNISIKHFGHSNLLTETIPVVANILGDTFPELNQKLFSSLDIVKYEEEYFQSLKDSLSKGIKEIIKQNPKLADLDLYDYPGFLSAYNEFNKYKKSNKKEISGEMTFQLYSTYGLDLDLIEKLAEIEKMSVDIEAFEEKMEQMKGKALGNLSNEIIIKLVDTIPPTLNDSKYDYKYDESKKLYKTAPIKSKIVAIFDDIGNQIENSSLAKSQNVKIVVEKSPFYYESGGQESDSGVLLINENSYEIKSITAQKNIIFHKIQHDAEKNISVGDEVELKVDDVKRSALIRNHSATHILNSVIRQLKKLPIYQKSSLVTDGQLKIELAMIGPKLNEGDIRNIEEAIKKLISDESLEAKIEVINFQELQNKSEIIMVPGEIYPENDIRVINFGNLSHELCCGTHVFNTKEIEDFTFSSVKSTGRISYLFTALTSNAAKNANNLGDKYLEKLKVLKSSIKLENLTDILSTVRRISTEINNVEISHLKKLQCLQLIDNIKEQLKIESRNVLSELLDIEMKNVAEKHADSKFIVHFIGCSDLMKNVSLQKATRIVSDDKPIIAISLADEEVKARCCIPKELISENFDAEKWLKSFAEVFKSKVEAPKGQNKLEVCFMKGRKVKAELFNDMLNTAMKNAEQYAHNYCQ